MAEVIARVGKITGEAFARDPDGNVRRLKSGDPIREGDVVQTAEGGQVQLTLADGRELLVGANEAAKIDAEVAAPELPNAGDSAVQNNPQGFIKVAKAIVGPDGTFSFDDDGGQVKASVDQKDGHTFIELMRIVENVDPLAFQFATTRFPLNDTIQGGASIVLVSQSVDLATPTPLSISINDVAPALSVSIGDAVAVNEGGSLQFTVTLSGGTSVSDLTIPLTYAGTADPVLDLDGEPVSVTILAGQTSATVTVPTFTDNIAEGNETVLVNLGTPPVGVSVVDGQGSGTINDVAPALSVSIGDAVAVNEGGSLQFTVTLSGGTSVSDLTIPLTYAGTADPVLDLDGEPVSVTILAGQTSATVTVPTFTDNIAEGNETVLVNLGTPPVGVSVVDGQGSGTINDVAPALSVSIGDAVAVNEGGSLQFTVTLSGGTSVSDLTIPLTYAGTADPVLDLDGEPVSVTILAGQTSATVTVPTFTDNIAEGNETVLVNLGTPPVGVSVVDGQGSGTINDVAPALSVSIGDAVAVNEGGSLQFTVTLSGGTSVSDLTIPLTYAGTADPVLDLDGEPVSVTILAGQTSATVTVPTFTDNIAEGNETVLVNLGTPPVGVSVVDGQGSGTINDVAPALSVSIGDAVAVNEGGSLQFTVTLSGGTSVSDLTIPLTYAGTADPVLDLDGEPVSVTILAGQTSATVTVPTFTDNIAEGNETVLVNLGTPPVGVSVVDGQGSGTINDVAPALSVSIGDAVAVNEGGSLQFTVTLSGGTSVSDLTIPLTYAGTADPVLDLDGEPVSVTILAGQTSATVTVPTFTDNIAEGNETVLVNLGTPPVGVSVVDGQGSGTINDVAPALSVSIGDAVAVNEGGSLQFTVTLSGGTSVSDLTIPLTYAGTADPVLDLDGEPVSVTILAGQTSATVTVPTFTDNIAEGNETVLVNLGTPPVGVSVVDGQGSGTINDVAPALSVSIGDAVAVNEGGSLQFTVTLSGGTSVSDLTIPLTYAGTADPVLDLDGEPVSVTILAGQTSATVTVPTFTDNIAEGNETVLVNLGTPPVGVSVVDGQGSGTINDVAPALSVSIGDAVAVNEGGSLQFTVTLSGGTSVSDLTIPLTYAGTADPVLDLDGEPVSVTILAGQTSATVTVPTFTDNIAEGNETVLVNLGTPPVGVSVVDGQGSGTINDVAPALSVSIGDAVAVNEGGSLQFTVTLSGGTSVSDLTIPLTYAGTADPVLDLDGEPVSVTILAGQTSATVTVPTFTDNIAEGNETVLVNLGTPPVGVSVVDGQGSGTINDVAPALSVSIGDAVAVNEGGSLQFTVTLSGGTSVSDLTIPLTYAGTADPVLDLDGEPVSVTILAGQTSATVTVPTFTDNIAEGNETVLVNLGTPPVGVSVVDGQGSGTINDVAPALSVSIGDAVAVNEGGSLQFTVTLSGGTSVSDLTIPLTYAGTADPVLDLDGEPVSVTILAGQTSATVTVPTFTDNIAEGNETVLVNLGTPPVGVSVVDGQGSGTINDVAPALSVSIGDAVAVNEGGSLQFTVTLSGGTSVSDLTIPLTYAGTADPVLDLDGEPVSVTILAGQTSATVTVPTFTDNIAEGNETVLVNLGTPPVGVSVVDGQGSGTINDVAPALSVSIGDAVAVNEGGSLQFTVTLSGGTSVSDLTIPLTYAGTADPVLDLDGEPVSVTILAGQTSATVTVPTFTDNIAEGNETVLVNLGTPPVGVSVVDGQGSGTINDTTPTLMIASVSAASGNEGTSLVHTVTLSGTSATGATTVSLSLAGSGATIGSDTGTVEVSTDGGSTWSLVTLGAGNSFSVDVPANTDSFQVRVAAIDDTLFEGTETYNLNAGIGAQAAVSGQGTILDNETPPTLAVSDVTVAESAGFAQFTVSLSRPSAAATTVSLALAGVSATAGGVDFGTAGAGNLQVSTNGGLTWTDAASYTFAPGTTSVLVRTPIVDDVLHEPGAGETFTLTATTTAGTTANLSAIGTATITDNDSQPTISVSDPFVAEGGQLAYTVTLSNPSTQTVTVAYATADGTAITGSGDYTAASSTLTFAPGVTTQTVYVQSLVNAPVGEPNETVLLNLTGATNATIADSQGVGTIMERIQAVPDGGTVYESALGSGTAASSLGEVFTGNLLGNDFSPTTKAINRVTFGGTNYTDLDADGIITVDTPLGYLEVFITAGTYGGIARQAGDYVYTLQTNSTAGDNVSEQFSYRITDGSNTSTSSLTIRVVDDAPVGNDVTQSLTASTTTLTYNLTIIFDVSGSMGDVVAGRTRMDLAQEAVATMLREYERLGDVNVMIVAFDNQTRASGWFDGDVASAIDYVNSLVPGSGTWYDDALNRVISEYAATPPPAADKSLIYFLSDGAPTSGHGLDATVAYGGQTGVAAWEKFVTDKADISFAIGVGSGVNLTSLRPVAYPNTNSDQYAQAVTNEAQLANTLLSTVQAGVAQGSTALIAGGAGDGLVLGADGGYVSRLVVDGVTYLYDPAAASQPNNSTLSSSLVERTFSTILGATLTFNFATGVYRYQVPPDSAISGRQEIFNVTGHDLDGDEKTVRLVIDVSYQAPLDGNRDQIITNIVDGSPITVSAEALLHNDAKSAATTVTSSGGAIDGTVSGSTSIVFDPDFAAGSAPTVAETVAANNTLATAIDLTARSGFGQIASADVGKVTNPALPGMLFTGGLSSNSDVDYIKVHLRAGERIVLDIDSTTGGLNSVVSLRNAADVQLAANDNDAIGYGGSGSSSGNDSYLQYTVPADGDYYIRVSSSGSASSGNYSLWIQVDPNTGFDYTISDGLTSDTAHADVLRVTGSTLTGTSGDEILIGGSGNETINAGDGLDVLQGGAGNDTLNGEAGNDLLEGGSGNDTLNGGDGLDRLVGGADTDTLTGGAGADTFVWQLADRGTLGTPVTDTVTDFDSVANSDKLDLRDLLQGEIANPALQNLEGYLHFEKSGANTVVHVSSTGGFSTGYSSSAEDQTIVLQNVDLVGSLTTDQAIIQNLLNQGKLITD